MHPFLIALVVNDALFATIIGTSFTASLALMAWIVKSLILLSAKVDRIDERVDLLERDNGQHARTRAPRPQ